MEMGLLAVRLGRASDPADELTLLTHAVRRKCTRGAKRMFVGRRATLILLPTVAACPNHRGNVVDGVDTAPGHC